MSKSHHRRTPRLRAGLLALALALAVQTQQARADEFETDRDSFTPSPQVLGRDESLLESSYSFIDNRVGPESNSFPELLVRHAIAERVELRMGWNFETGGSGTISGTEVGGEDLISEQESRVLYGTKVQTTYQDGWLPRSSFILEGFTPTSGPSNGSSVVGCQVVGWTFANGWQWNSAFRYGTGEDKGDSLNQWAPSTVLEIPLHERWTVHAEYFSIITSGAANDFNHQFASFGGHVLPTPNLELGARVGGGLNAQSPPFFSNIGLAVRF